MKIYSVSSAEFKEYGRVITDVDFSEIIEAAKTIDLPNEGSMYVPSEPKFETCAVKSILHDVVYGEMDIQIGYCWGYNSKLNALEWHKDSEINVAVTPLVLILGRLQDMENGRIDSASLKAFRLEAGETVEVYSTSLHFCPCQTEKSGFGCVVVLPKGTNVPLDKSSADPYLFRKNKWIIAHDDNSALIAKGVKAGIYGENYEIPFGN